VSPAIKPLIVDFGSAGASIVAVPEITDQMPVPAIAASASRVVEETLHKLWSAPANAAEGVGEEVIERVSVEIEQLPFVIFHCSTDFPPIVKLVTPDAGSAGSVTVAVPDKTVQFPVPVTGVFAESVELVTLHKFCEGPATATSGGAALKITTSSSEGVHVPLEIVHFNVTVSPGIKSVMVVFLSEGSVIVTVPATTDQFPVPETTVFPSSVVLVALQRFWSVPALEVVGNSYDAIEVSLEEEAQNPLEIVHLKVEEVPGTNPVTPEFGSFTSVTEAGPVCTFQIPVPVVGVLAESVAIVWLQSSWSIPVLAVVGGALTITSTSLAEGVQTPLATVHLKVAVSPITNPDTLDVGEFRLAIVAAPETTLHVPVPILGESAASVVVVTLQSCCSVPATDVEGGGVTVIVTFDWLMQFPFVILHLKTEAAPTVKLVTPELGEVGVVIEAVPDITDHWPVPIVGVLAANVAVVTLQSVWLGPAFETVGVLSVFIITFEVDAGQVPLEIVHLSVAEFSSTNPVTVEVGEDGVVIVAVPEIKLQLPVPIVGLLAARVVVVTPQRFCVGPALANVGFL
jgi:methylaspartate ammonia-lyase